MKKTNNTPLAAAMGVAFISTFATTSANAEANPFGMSELSQGYMQVAEADKAATDKAAEMACGANMKKEGDKAAEAACGANMKSGDKAAEGACGAHMTDDKAKTTDSSKPADTKTTK